MIIALVLASCGNKKTVQVIGHSDEKLTCTSEKRIGSNIPIKVCQTITERKQERKNNEEKMREARKGS